ncbi:MAG: 1-acyl-sn-glycerol-3-phosphate acyltransferase [Bacteroidales bacterium]|nr:1-acyl-sn-glycerol-3-phosphate acyltransferase [Bacteroidales bacterium]
MKELSIYLLDLFGWEIKGKFPDIKKSVVIFAPHTSYWDGLYGKLFLMQFDISYKFLSKKEFFKFPMRYFFKAFGSIPVYKSKEYINQIAELFNNNKELHIVLSPEGQLAKTTHWKKGFYYMAEKANVPIVVGYIDYKKKELGIKGVITENDNISTTITKINRMYKDVNAKYPENFATDKRFN